MKKIFWIGLLLSLLLFNRINSIYGGPVCTQLGGTCKPVGNPCSGNSTQRHDCNPGPPVPETCCIPSTPTPTVPSSPKTPTPTVPAGVTTPTPTSIPPPMPYPTCNSLGGNCKLSCSSSEDKSQGGLDCPRGGGRGPAGETCCIPLGSGGIGDILIPGVDCGNAIADDPAQRKCCPTSLSPPDLSLADKIGGTGTFFGNFVSIFFNDIKDRLLQIQDKTEVPPCIGSFASTTDPANPDCVCQELPNITTTPIASVRKLCEDYLPVGSKEQGSCIDCANNNGVWSAIGCTYADFGKFITETIFSWGIGFAGLVAILCIIYAAFILQTSQGNPERIKKAQEWLTSCIMGLMLIIFSVFILKIIGVEILKIPILP